MAATITLRFAGTCRDCGASLEAGARARYYGRGRVYGLTCHPQKPQEPASRTTRSYARGRWSAPARQAVRCEDAPCCGCCGPNGDGAEPFPGYGY